MAENRNERMQEITQRQSETALFDSREDRYGIYQLADEGNGQAYRFMGMTLSLIHI